MEQRDSFNLFAKILFAFVGIIIGFVLFRLFFVPIKIDTAQMEPALKDGEYCMFYKTKHVSTGSIVCYKSPLTGFLVGRVIAKSGDTVEIVNKRVYINGIEMTPQWKIKMNDTRIFPSRFVNRDTLHTVLVPNGHVFILGDNWDIPNDSRMFGTIPIDDIAGRYSFTLIRKK